MNVTFDCSGIKFSASVESFDEDQIHFKKLEAFVGNKTYDAIFLIQTENKLTDDIYATCWNQLDKEAKEWAEL